jgi:multiple sugar transport system ATP-binding protein
VVLSDTAGTWRTRVRHVERLGADAIAYLDAEGLGELVARAQGDSRLVPGGEVWASAIPGREHRFSQSL